MTTQITIADEKAQGIASLTPRPQKPVYEMIADLKKSHWLSQHHESERKPWLDALGVLLTRLKWQGDIARLSDVLPRVPLDEGADDLLNALASLGFVAQEMKSEADLLMVAAPPYLVMVEEEGELTPKVVTDWQKDGFWTLAELDENGVSRDVQEETPRSGIRHIYAIESLIDLHDASEEFARTQTGYSWMRTLLMRFRGLFGELFIVSFLVGTLSIAVPLFVMSVYDLVIDSHSIYTLGEATELLFFLLLGVSIAMGTESLLRLSIVRSLAWFGSRMHVLVGTGVVGQLLSLSPSLTERASVTDQLSRIRAFDSTRDFISGSQMMSLLELPWVALLLLVIGIIGGQMVFVPMLGIGAFVLLAWAVQKPLQYEMFSSARSSSERQVNAMDILTNLSAMKYGGVTESMFGRYSSSVRKSMYATFRINMMVAVLEHTAHAITAVGGVLTLVVGINLIWAGSLSVGALIAMMILTWRVLGIVQSNCVLQPRFHYMRTSIEQINRLMQMRSEEVDYQRELADENIRGRLEANGLALRYTRTGEYVLRGLSFVAEPGQLVAVMGQSGSGKSTLLKVLADLYPPQAGNVRIDGVNIRQYVPYSLRQHLAYMPQQPAFFSGTIAENLLLVAPDATDDELREALTAAGAVEEINAMPDGLATQVGIGKTHLPPSLAHRLNLARVYLQDKKILLLDELPYDVLNSTTGEHFLKSIKAAKGQRTTVFVTHRMDFAEHADIVVWMRHDMAPLIGSPQYILSAMQKEQVS